MPTSMKDDFFALAATAGALRFGEFETKAHRLSPYFFNAGHFNNGALAGQLWRFYAETIKASGLEFDNLYGPPYKGISLAAGVAVKLGEIGGPSVAFTSSRKEVKDHGEGGALVGAPLQGRILIIDDVISAGTSVRESVELIRNHGATPAGVAVALDRQERGTGALSAVQEVEQTYGIPVISIVTLADLAGYLGSKPEHAANLKAISAYRERYGVS